MNKGNEQWPWPQNESLTMAPHDNTTQHCSLTSIDKPHNNTNNNTNRNTNGNGNGPPGQHTAIKDTSSPTATEWTLNKRMPRNVHV
ncbi:hypothetical protein ACLKA6_010759 [Drosophila palustris]